ncbi:PREDICTED: transmembrane protein 45A-like isoform X1 [Dipodomys ordii]|uniref:Transmembrane protein 45A-like isoform X1 n=1 Tax=Dipodomys ordii TaxID=10020 RepID=A0A1S3FSQ3_DIPOR|nr:PREDICTED: transmembrane protein 45A-like isoform X1 [Dipodomys ordii]
MGSFRGHALPGTYFFLMSFWWIIKSILKYVSKKQKRICYLGTKASTQRVELVEGIILIFMALSGIGGEQFLNGGPSLILYKEGQWNQLDGWHHCTMYFFFGLMGVSKVLCSTINSLPGSLVKLMMSNALFVEGFIFYNHTHGREMLDIFVHQMLCLVVLLAGIVSFLEFLTKNNVLLELLRSSLLMLQGTWFWQVAFVLYPPNGSPKWDLKDHNNRMFLSICLCWHYAFTYMIIGVSCVFVTWLVKWRLRRLCPSEVGLLKNTEREQESEEEV